MFSWIRHYLAEVRALPSALLVHSCGLLYSLYTSSELAGLSVYHSHLNLWLIMLGTQKFLHAVYLLILAHLEHIQGEVMASRVVHHSVSG